MDEIYFMEGNHPGVVYHGPKSALESRQRRDGGTWWAMKEEHVDTDDVVREVDAEGWLISHDPLKSS